MIFYFFPLKCSIATDCVYTVYIKSMLWSVGENLPYVQYTYLCAAAGANIPSLILIPQVPGEATAEPSRSTSYLQMIHLYNINLISQ